MFLLYLFTDLHLGKSFCMQEVHDSKIVQVQCSHLIKQISSAIPKCRSLGNKRM